MIQDRHYKLNKGEGYINFFDSVTFQAEDMIAIYLRTTDPDIRRGDTIQDTLLNLWTIKPNISIDSAQADTSRFYLMWRNVYEFPSLTDYNQFKVKVELQLPGGGTVEERNKKKANISPMFLSLLLMEKPR